MRQLLKYALSFTALLLIAVPALAQSGTSNAQTGSGTSIALGDTVTGTLTTAQPSVTYTLQAEAGQAVDIQLTSSDFDAYLLLEDGSGNVLAENDDSSGTDSEIQSFVLPQEASYQIVVESYGQYESSGAETGSYTLTVTERQINHIEYGQTINDRLTSDESSKDYVFTGTAGDVIVASEVSNDFDSYLYLLDSSGTQLTSNDDTGNTLNSLIGPYTLPSDGSYTIRASTYDSSTTGAFTLTLNKATVTAVNYDEPIKLDFTADTGPQYFTFSGTSGDLVSITANSDSTVDTNLTLNDSTGSQIASDEDGGQGFDPEIFQQLLTSSDTYTVILQPTAPGVGTVTLTIKHTSPPSLDEGAQTVSFSSSTTERAVSFTAVAGQTVRLTLHAVNGAVGSPDITVTDSDQNTIASGSFSSISEATFSFRTSSDGNLVVQVTEYSGNLSYTVTLDHPSE